MYPSSGPVAVSSSSLPGFSGLNGTKGSNFNNSLSQKVSSRLIDLASKGDVRGVCSLVSQRVDLDAQLDCEEWNPLQFFVAEGNY